MTKIQLLSLLFCVVHLYASAQQIPTLPKISLKKLSNIADNKTRIIRYYKMMRRDSVRRDRIQKRLFKNLVDSTVRANRRRIFGVTDSLTLKRGKTVFIDSAIRSPAASHTGFAMQRIDSVAATQIPALQSMPGRIPPQLTELKLDSLRQKIPSVLQERLQTLLPPENLDHADNTVKTFSQTAGVVNTDLPEKPLSLFKSAADDQIALHQEKILGAQQRISKLLRRYSEFSNSGNLDEAVKRNSLAGKSSTERIVFDAQTNVNSVAPFSMDVAALAGYRLSRVFSGGAGINVRFSGSDSIPSNHYISDKHLGVKAFLSYVLVKNCFLYGEGEGVNVRTIKNERAHKTKVNNVMVGLGRKFLLHPKVYMTLTAVYNLNPNDENPIHPRRFQIRSGFQLSELALRKKNINYDPNR